MEIWPEDVAVVATMGAIAAFMGFVFGACWMLAKWVFGG